MKSFYLLINWGAQTKIPEDAGDFRLLSPRAADALRAASGRNRFFKGLSSWIGFRQIRIDYHPAPRADGRSTWSLRSLIGLSIDGLTGVFGGAAARRHWLGSCPLALTASFMSAKSSTRPSPTASACPAILSLFVGVMVLGGVQLIMLGVVGEYIGKILYEIKGRPVYFVAEHAVKPREEAKHPEARHPDGGGMSLVPRRGYSPITITLAPTFTRAVEVDDVLVAQPDAARRHLRADDQGSSWMR